ncbi:hypothetical protein PoB_004284000 [Plakobranchus ocellatus]|uniref:Uncharacterized protein n=1 Tax=Plakobranchus ocellatus TaxID=259542 RepID=A0AAV4BB59_9GAST|nr:hypothetical protein PoB_004284000 [Plakobranchus ocellatus]
MSLSEERPKSFYYFSRNQTVYNQTLQSMIYPGLNASTITREGGRISIWRVWVIRGQVRGGSIEPKGNLRYSAVGPQLNSQQLILLTGLVLRVSPSLETCVWSEISSDPGTDHGPHF